MTDSILVLDAHRNFYDIFATARHLQRTRHPKRLLLPAAGYLFYLPLVKNFLRFLARRYHLEYFPVYRQVEYSPLNLSMRLFVSFYPASLTPKKRQAANRHFISECSRALQKPGNIVLVSPYGSPVLFGGKVK